MRNQLVFAKASEAKWYLAVSCLLTTGYSNASPGSIAQIGYRPHAASTSRLVGLAVDNAGGLIVAALAGYDVGEDSARLIGCRLVVCGQRHRAVVHSVLCERSPLGRSCSTGRTRLPSGGPA